MGIFWDTLKTFLGGQFIHVISNTKTGTKEWESTIVWEGARAESNYIAQPNYNTKRVWLEVQGMAYQVTLTKAENKRFFQQQTSEQWEGTGHMLAMMAKAIRSVIPALTKSTGELITSHRAILSI